MHRRQLGYGRGGRQKIEKDRVELLSGVRHGQTIGAPIAMRIENRDWANWEKALSVEEVAEYESAQRRLTAPRPGHADLSGAMKFNLHDARYILERASARETAARVAAGPIAKLLLRQLDCDVLSHVISVGKARLDRAASWTEIETVCANLDSPLRCVDAETEAQMKKEVDVVQRAGNTVGGIFEVVAHNVVTGLGTHVQWDEKLDGRLAQAVMSIQAVKGVEIGAGIAAADFLRLRSDGRNRIRRSCQRFTRATNRAGGLEGGITNGEDVIVRGYLKPISTLRTPLGTVDMVTKQPISAAYERSDVCVVPAGGVAGEAMVSIVLAGAMIEKFGGDSLGEMRRNFDGYLRAVEGVLKPRMPRISGDRAGECWCIYCPRIRVVLKIIRYPSLSAGPKN